MPRIPHMGLRVVGPKTRERTRRSAASVSRGSASPRGRSAPWTLRPSPPSATRAAASSATTGSAQRVRPGALRPDDLGLQPLRLDPAHDPAEPRRSRRPLPDLLFLLAPLYWVWAIRGCSSSYRRCCSPRRACRCSRGRGNSSGPPWPRSSRPRSCSSGDSSPATSSTSTRGVRGAGRRGRALRDC